MRGCFHSAAHRAPKPLLCSPNTQSQQHRGAQPEGSGRLLPAVRASYPQRDHGTSARVPAASCSPSDAGFVRNAFQVRRTSGAAGSGAPLEMPGLPAVALEGFVSLL